jgi:hypothetical protein
MAWFEREFTKKLREGKIYFSSGRGLRERETERERSAALALPLFPAQIYVLRKLRFSWFFALIQLGISAFF